MNKLKNVLAAQTQAIRIARRLNKTIIVIEYDIAPSETHPDNRKTVSTLKSALRGYGKVRFFKKTTDGAFHELNEHRTGLIEYLKKREIKHLVVAGANGRSCVYETVSQALRLGFEVTTFNHGIADFGDSNFIYPFVGGFQEIHSSCQHCKFTEINTPDQLIGAMTR